MFGMFCLHLQGRRVSWEWKEMYLIQRRSSGVPRAGVWGVQTPPEIPKALQNRAKLNPIVKTVKNC